jgi:hypothetical protein
MTYPIEKPIPALGSDPISQSLPEPFVRATEWALTSLIRQHGLTSGSPSRQAVELGKVCGNVGSSGLDPHELAHALLSVIRGVR